MHISAIVLSILKQLPKKFITSLIQFFLSMKSELIPAQLARCCLMFSSAVTAKQFRKLYLPFLRECHPMSLESVSLYLALSWSNPDDVFSDGVPRLATDFLSTEIPSFFCSGIRLFERGLSSLPDRKVQQLFRTGFPQLIKNFERFLHIFPIAENAGNSWIAILSMPNLTKYASQLLMSSPNLVPAAWLAAFPSIMLCIPQMMSICVSDKRLWGIGNELQRKMLLVTFPTSLLQAKIFIKMIAVRAEKESDQTRRESFAIDVFRSWIRNGLKFSDCYSVADLVFDWCVIMLKICGLLKLIPFLTSEMFESANRFFPVFAGVVKFIRSRLGSQKPEMMQMLKDEMIKTGRNCQCRAHGMALMLVMAGKSVRMVLDLAKFDDDCKESDRLVEECSAELEQN
jgi:hypothetical protein